MTALVFCVDGEPLGVNALYRSVAGRSIKSREGRAYSAHFVACAVRARLDAGGAGALDVPVAVTLRIFFGSERPDIDGPVKICLDSMECSTPRRDGAGIYRNDRLVRRLVVERHVDRARPRVEVRVEAMEASAPPPKLPRTSAFGASCRVPLRQDDAAESRATQRRITDAANVTRSSVRKFR